MNLATIKRWQQRGLPLDDPDALATYLTSGGSRAKPPAPVPETLPRWRDVPEREW